MPAVTNSKPIDLEPIRAQAANASAPSMALTASTQAAATGSTSAATACTAAASMWAGLAVAVVDDEATRQGIIASGQRRFLRFYAHKTEAVTTLVTTDDENRQALTLLPGGTVAV